MSTRLAQILLRHDSEANWLQEDPVLGSGELGLDTTHNRWRFGDGLTTWSTLPELIHAQFLPANFIDSPDELPAGIYLLEGSAEYNSGSKAVGAYVVQQIVGTTRFGWEFYLGMAYNADAQTFSDPHYYDGKYSRLAAGRRLVLDNYQHDIQQYPGEHCTTLLANNGWGWSLLVHECVGNIIHQKLIFAGNYELHTTQPESGKYNISYSVTPTVVSDSGFTYEIWSRTIVKVNDLLIDRMGKNYQVSEWKLVESSYEVPVSLSYISNQSIESIVNSAG